MTSPLSSDIPKPFGSSEKAAGNIAAKLTPSLPIPAFSDLGKAANDLINKDFYHASQATLDVKLKAPNGTNITVKGKQGFDGVTSGSVEGKHTLKPQGKPAPPFLQFARILAPLPSVLRSQLYLAVASAPAGDERVSLTVCHPAGLSITQAWTTASLLDTKLELADLLTPGVKAELQNLWNPSKPNALSQKLNLTFRNPTVCSRAFINHGAHGGFDATVDVTAGHEGFVVGGEAAYDVQKAALTRYSMGVAYQSPLFTATLVGMQNLSVFTASYHQKVNSSVEVATKASYDVQAGKAQALELASKYRLDPLSFAKVKINDRGIAALAYSTKLNAGTTIGLGLSLDTAKINEAGHKIGTSLTFEG